jgi:hypothetical protein
VLREEVAGPERHQARMCGVCVCVCVCLYRTIPHILLKKKNELHINCFCLQAVGGWEEAAVEVFDKTSRELATRYRQYWQLPDF